MHILSGATLNTSLSQTLYPEKRSHAPDHLAQSLDLFEPTVPNHSAEDALPIVTPGLFNSIASEKSSHESPLLRGTSL